jgi:4-diphosphocytidyl-2-C-methyl-D-erythritol kinase
VNLFLRILEREPSGFHRIETVFQTLELSDRVAIEVPTSEASPAIELRVEGVRDGELGSLESNLAYREARRFQQEMSARELTPPAFGIVLEKRIPHGAGLGGGSSDAATVLLGANTLAGHPLSREDLLRIGGELGSDVSFFLIGAARAHGAGRGEILRPLPPLPPREVLLLVPAEGISSGWAFSVLAAARSALPPPQAFHPQDAEGWTDVAALAENDFESVLFRLRPALEEMKGLLLRHGASPALLSGSGSVIFGIFQDVAALEAASREAAKSGVRTLQTRTRAQDAVI